MIGEAYRSTAVQTVLGPARSQLIPAVLWVGWLDAAGDVVAVTDSTVSHDVWEPTGSGVTNSAPIDCGVAGDGWTVHAVGLFDAADGDLVISAALTEPLSPTAGDPLVFDVGGILFEVT